jgi:hypothetical protein
MPGPLLHGKKKLTPFKIQLLQKAPVTYLYHMCKACNSENNGTYGKYFSRVSAPRVQITWTCWQSIS